MHTKPYHIMSNRKVSKIIRGSNKHWVGDGFLVSSMFSYRSNDNISPFLLLDYAEALYFSPLDKSRGIGQHPHRGFETVTIVYEGEVEHRDTAGNVGKIGPGDVQWMTAARGILHEEKHSYEFSRKGGVIEMVQLWINLPAKYKMSEPRYQEILNANIPIVQLANNAGLVRVIAGHFAGCKGVAETFTPIHLYDIRLKAGTTLNVPVEENFNASLLVLGGKLHIADEALWVSEAALFEQKGDVITLHAENDSKVLFMSGEPINEPVVGAGPFVMNTEAEVHQAFTDFRTGKLQ